MSQKWTEVEEKIEALRQQAYTLWRVKATMTGERVEQLLADANDRWVKASEVLKECDEVSILFGSAQELIDFVQIAVQRPEVKLFNTARDNVSTSPILSQYWVSYWFLEGPWPYRIEAMNATPGSPLHDARLVRNPNPHIIHASFKCASEMQYAVAMGELVEIGHEIVQRCESNYGLFSYWDVGDEEGCYLKPRLSRKDM